MLCFYATISFFFLHIRISSILFFFRYFIYLFFASNIWQLVVVVVVVLCVGKMRKMKCKYLRCVLYFIVFYLNIYSTLEGIYSIEISVVVVVVALFFHSEFLSLFFGFVCFCFTVLYSTIKFNYCWSFALGRCRKGGGNLQLCAVIYVAASCQVSRGESGEGEWVEEKATYFHITRANRLSVYGPEMSSKSHLGCQIITLSPTKVY